MSSDEQGGKCGDGQKGCPHCGGGTFQGDHSADPLGRLQIHGFCDQAIRRVGSRSAEVYLSGSAYTRGGESVGRPRLRKQSRKVRTPQGRTVGNTHPG